MNSRQIRRRCAVIGAAATITMTTALAPTASSAADTEEGPTDRPCFMIQSHWNTGYDGPQPTCPTPTWQMQDDNDEPLPDRMRNVSFTGDFMP
ncbi:hypothetical protein [Nocardioides terrigena]|uniref:hypothetical protein n=1 Tax=Nocardioides terrigena TaxID=424797 RepID=UPI000D317923|nr:hypothetical protein [Nocardioides terrigena]